MSAETRPSPEPAPRGRLGVHLAWALAFVAVAVLVFLGLSWWLGLRASAELLRPRVLEELRTSLSGLAGRQEAFLVAYEFSTRTSAEATKSYFLGDLAVGSSEVQASWRYAVDFGIDLNELGELGDLPGSLACDETARRCTWTVPAPRHRKPAIDSTSIRLTSRGSLLVTDSLERGHREEVLRQLSHLTLQELRRPEFQALVRENVRAGLEQLARNLVAGSAAGAVDFDVVFADDLVEPERRAIRPLEPAESSARP